MRHQHVVCGCCGHGGVGVCRRRSQHNHRYLRAREFRYRHKSDAGDESGGWQRSSDEQTFRTYNALASWKVQPQVRNVTQTSAELAWTGPPVESPSDFE